MMGLTIIDKKWNNVYKDEIIILERFDPMENKTMPFRTAKHWIFQCTKCKDSITVEVTQDMVDGHRPDCTECNIPSPRLNTPISFDNITNHAYIHTDLELTIPAEKTDHDCRLRKTKGRHIPEVA